MTAPVWQSSDAELLAELSALETQMHATWAQMLSVVAEIDSRGTAATVGYGTTVELIRAVARVPRGEARARVSAAADVLPGAGWVAHRCSHGCRALRRRWPIMRSAPRMSR